MVATALDDPRGLNRKKAKAKGKINLASGKVGKKGKGKKAPTVVSVDGEPAEGTAAAAGGDKVLDMQSREKKLKRELNKRAKKFMKGDTVNTKNVKDKKTKAHVKYANELADKAATDAALHEKWLLPSTPGAIEAEGDERTWRFKQDAIMNAVDINAARKAFDLSLPTLGPYYVDFTPNGRDVLIGGRKGHVAMIRWSDYKLITEVQLKETVRDVKFMHSGQFFACAQRKYAYIYDNRGQEVHCLKDHTEVNRLEFLNHHFLLCTIGDQGVLRYQDTTYGKIIAQHRTKLGPCDAMRQNPQNGIIHLGHSNGTVTLWSPNMGHSLVSSFYNHRIGNWTDVVFCLQVKMLCHRGPVRSLAVDTSGRYMATCGADSQVKTWDVRMYKEIHSYYSAVPAVHVDISQRGMLGVGYGGRVQIWDQALNGPKAQAPYLNHQFRRGEIVRDFAFCPYDDAVGVGHSGGFSNLIVPGAGEPNYDSLIANPFETRNQRREQEVAQLLDKLPAEMIQLDPDGIGVLRAVPKEVQKERREKALEAQMSATREKREANLGKTRMKGKNKVSKRYRKKQANVVDDKKLRARMLAEETKRKAAAARGDGSRGAGGGADGGGAMPGQTAGAASTAPNAPKDVSAALRRFYK
jgi:U3 small nucleolar RNA-associated protein 7